MSHVGASHVQWRKIDNPQWEEDKPGGGEKQKYIMLLWMRILPTKETVTEDE